MNDHSLPPTDPENLQDNAIASPKPPKSSFLGDLLDYLEVMVLALCVIIALFSFSGLRLCTVDGASMENTLHGGERLLTWGSFYTPERNDIVVFHQTSDVIGDFNKPIVKRVIGLPGDTVHVDYLTQTVTVTDKNGQVTVLEESAYRKLDGWPNYPFFESVYVEEGTVFVLGDNRNNSADSRDPHIGLVDQRRILGKVILRITPFSRFGEVS